jgi:hypothetical protein
MPLEIEDDVLTVDRSTLEGFCNCPAQSLLRESGIGRTVGEIAVVGEEVHKAISDAIDLYIGSGGSMDRKVIQEELHTNLRAARPDVQPQVVKAFASSVWPFSDWLWRLHASNILRFDGGRGDRSGQLSLDFTVADQTVRVTSELDVLYSTASPEVIEEMDWKTGWKPWSPESVQESFQFQLHALLVFGNYPEIQALRTRIWSRRSNGPSWATEFRRDRLKPIESRVLSAIGDWLRWKDAIPAKAETRPTAEKCRICPVSHKCPVADMDVPEMLGSPAKWLDRLASVEETAKTIKKRLSVFVDLTGNDVVGTGIGFGNDKPNSTRKTPKRIYKIGERDDDGDSDADE